MKVVEDFDVIAIEQFSPSRVAIHIRDFSSWQISLTVICDNPSSTPNVLNLYSCDRSGNTNPKRDSRIKNGS